jgi:hypothetical protein
MWRDNGRTVRIFGIDWRAAALLLLALLHISLWTFVIAIVGIAILVILERWLGYTVPNALRRLNIVFFGASRPAMSHGRRGRSDR